MRAYLSPFLPTKVALTGNCTRQLLEHEEKQNKMIKHKLVSKLSTKQFIEKQEQRKARRSRFWMGSNYFN